MMKKIVFGSLSVTLNNKEIRMSFSHGFAILFFGAVVSFAGSTIAAPVYSNGFENDTVGTIPAGWTHVQGWNGTANGVVVASPDPVKSGDHSFKIIDSVSSHASGWKTSSFTAPTSGKVEWEFSIYLQATNQQVEALIFGNSAIYGGVFFRSDGTLGYPSGGTWTVPTAVTYTTGEWHNVSIVANIDNSTYTLFFDGARVATAVPAFSAIATFDEIRLQGNTTAITTFYADDISIDVVPEGIFYDGFEYAATNTIPADWTHVQGWNGTANGVVVGSPDPVKSGDHSFKIIDSVSSFASGWKTSSFTAPTSGKVEWKFSVYLQATNQQVEALVSGNSAIYGGVFFRSNGTLGYPSGGAWTVPTAVTYTTGEWHNVSIVVDIDNSDYTLSFDEEIVATSASAYSATATFNEIMLQGNQAAVTSFYVDDVSIDVVRPVGTAIIIK